MLWPDHSPVLHHLFMPKPRIHLFGRQPCDALVRRTGGFQSAWPRLLIASRHSAAFIVLFLALAGPAGSAREIHVATTGQDTAPGTPEQPLRTISAAAQLAEPGDSVTVQAGTYRERVKPARGGTSERQRVVYRTAPNEEVVIKGSERITGWTQLGGGVWKVELPNAFFGDYNPYALNLSGGWLNYGQWHHRGDVYLDEEAFVEQRTLEEVRQRPQTWCCGVQGSTTMIWANFGTADPIKHLAEINVRESLFMPEISGLSDITIDGFHFLHAAANWAPPGTRAPRAQLSRAISSRKPTTAANSAAGKRPLLNSTTASWTPLPLGFDAKTPLRALCSSSR